MPEAETDTQTDVAEEESKNIWQELLAASSNQEGWETAQTVGSTLIVLGDKTNGKSSVLNKFANRVTNVNTPEYILDYSYVNVKNKHNLDKDETVSRMSVWQLDDHNHKDLLVNLVSPDTMSTSCYMITADLAQPWNLIASLTKWLEVAKEINDQLLSKLTEEQVTELKTNVSRYNQFFVDFAAKKPEEPLPEPEAAAPATATEGDEKAATEGEGENTEETKVSTEISEEDSKELAVDLSKPEVNLGVPIMIVCNKADYFNRVLTKQGADDKFNLIAHQLRKLAMKYGATLVFTSAFGEGINIDMCQDYLFHRLFKFPLNHSAKVVGSAEDVGLYIPAGYDSEDLLASGMKLKNGWDDKTVLETVFENPESSGVDKKSAVLVTAASNEVFFKGLRDQLDKGHSGTAGVSSSTTGEGDKDVKRNEKVVKSFFKSLLSGPASGAGGAQREQARAAASEITK